jgi:hypothetical protein
MTMTKKDIADFIDRIVETFPERMSGNEENTILVSKLANIVVNERAPLVELLTDWISIRIKKTPDDHDFGKKVGQLFLALELMRSYGIEELRQDVEVLIEDTRAGKTYLPYYADMIERYLLARRLG